MSEVAEAREDWFEWCGLIFKRAAPRASNSGTETDRFECEEYPFRGRAVRYTHGQWIASFEEGPYAIAYDRETALEEARLKALDNLRYKQAMFRNLWAKSALW